MYNRINHVVNKNTDKIISNKIIKNSKYLVDNINKTYNEINHLWHIYLSCFADIILTCCKNRPLTISCDQEQILISMREDERIKKADNLTRDFKTKFIKTTKSIKSREWL
jgi:hypothetical protein